MLPENKKIVEWYLRCQTQWHCDQGRRTGLNYDGCRAVADITGIEVSSETFAGLQTIEYAMLEADHDIRERAQNV